VKGVLSKITSTKEDMCVTPEELHVLLTAGPSTLFRHQLKEVAEPGDPRFSKKRGTLAMGGAPSITGGRGPMRISMNEAGEAEKTRENLVGYVADQVEKNDALMTLPITLVYIFVFIFLVWQHLRIQDRRFLAEAVESWTNGRDPFTDLENNVDDMDSYWEWLLGVALPETLNQTVTNAYTGLNQSVFASRNIFVGDFQISKEDVNGNVDTSWLLNSDVGSAYLVSNPMDWTGAALAAATSLANNGWKHSDISLLTLTFVTYSETVQMFGYTEVQVFFEATGFVRYVINTTVVMIRLYPYYLVLIADFFFVMILTLLSWAEIKDMVAHLKLGLDEFVDYWKFWNCVDWSCIVLGFAVSIFWIYLLFAVNADIILYMIDDDWRLKIDAMALSTDNITVLQDTLSQLGWVFFYMHMIMAVNTLTIVMKFFKAFQANPRLEVVRNTLAQAAPDLCHFFIIFLTIFLPFAMVGHILFGNDIEDFSSISSSVNAGITALFGEFGWYVDDVGPLRLTRRLPSGIPHVVVFLWYASYMFVVLLVLLNMLLAVILGHYGQIADKLGDDSLTIWTQLMLFWKFQKDTRRFITLESLLLQLENDDAPAHEEEAVTKNSLLEAFPDMEAEQAGWLMKNLEAMLNSEVKLLMQDSETRRMQHMESLMESTCEELSLVSKAIQETKDAVELSKKQPPRVKGPAKVGPDARIDRIQRDVARITDLLKENPAARPARPARSRTRKVEDTPQEEGLPGPLQQSMTMPVGGGAPRRPKVREARAQTAPDDGEERPPDESSGRRRRG